MKMNVLKSWLMMAVAVLVLWSGRTTVVAQDDTDDKREAVRMERLENQVQRLSAQQTRQPGQVALLAAQRLQPAPVGSLPGNAAVCGPATQKCYRRCCPILCVVIGLLAVIHILLATWVFTDIRKRGEGSGLFIVLALLAGIPGTILYALVRLGDRVGEKKV